MHLSAYLARIGLDALPPPTVEGLHTLQDHHMRHVPFENLDVVMGRSLRLDPESLFEKIVTRRRGGYCFELNTLYAELLRAAGFAPVPMMARVWLREPEDVPPRTHLVHRVVIDGDWWVTDVGFGGRAARVPLRLDDPVPVDDGDGRIRIIPDATFGYRVQREENGGWANQYSTEFAPAHPGDIACGNHWTETHPDSHFRHGVGVGLFTKVGRDSFYGGVLARRGRDEARETVSSLGATLSVLRDVFGIELHPSDEEQAQLRSVLPQGGA